MPRNALVSRPRAEEVKSDADVRDDVTPILRRFTSPHDTIPRTHLLSNGRYSVMVTTAGSGYSHWRQHAVTRWREDVTCDPWGSFLYVRDTNTGAFWSAGYQPSGREADTYEVSYSEDQATFARRDGSIATGLTIMVSAEDDAEIRRVSLTNLGSRVRELELTSYQEVVLAPQAADVAHPAFQNLFVQTEYDAGDRCAARHAPAALERRGAAVGGARGDGRRSRRRCDPVRDRPGSIPRARALGAVGGVGRRRTPAVEQRRSRARPDLQPAAASRRRTGRDGARDLRHRGRRVARAGDRPGRQVSNSGHVRAGPDPRLDPCPGAAPPPRHRRRRGATLPATRQQAPLLRSVAAAAAERARRQPARGSRHSGRTGSPATCRSWWSASTNSTTSTSFDSCCGRTSTGA